MQLPEAASFDLLGSERAKTVAELLELAPACGLPWLNLLAGDQEGNIGWTLGGRFPKRVGFDGRTPVSWADGLRGWQGWVEPRDMPRLLNPPSGAVWSANDRALGNEAYRRLMGGHSLDDGARSRQIRDQLLGLTNAVPADLLAIQLDDRARFLESWQQLLLQTLDRAPTESPFREARPLVANWGARAAADSPGYAIVREFRRQVVSLLLAPAAERCRAFNPLFSGLPGSSEGVAWDLLGQRPIHLLSRSFTSYDGLLATAARNVCARHASSRARGAGALNPWNRVQLQHPFGRAIPWLSRWLDLPERPLPGDNNMPRVQGQSFGASERLVVSPGREAEGIFHMPGGQSGHFLSGFYAAGHRDWEEGRPSPLLPGPTRHVLTLRP
jgi:penicillin amidase